MSYFAHEIAVIEEGFEIGQKVVISPEVILIKNCKVQNNVSILLGVHYQDDILSKDTYTKYFRDSIGIFLFNHI